MLAIWLGKPAVAQMKPASELESGQMSRGGAPMYRAVQKSDASVDSEARSTGNAADRSFGACTVDLSAHGCGNDPSLSKVSSEPHQRTARWRRVYGGGMPSGIIESRHRTMSHLCPGQVRTSIRRRALLLGGFAGAIGCVFPAAAHAATAIVLPTAAANRRFSVLYKGFRIGNHTISNSPATGETRVSTEIHIEVKVAFVTAYAFSHRSEEVWRAGRLVSLNSDTVDRGESLHVEGSATPQGFRVVGKSGPYIASAATLTSNSIWTPAMLEQSTVVDAERGGIIGVSAHKVAEEPITIAAGQVQATRYTFITPYYAGSVWYDNSNLWVRAEFERDGSKVEYQLDT